MQPWEVKENETKLKKSSYSLGRNKKIYIAVAIIFLKAEALV